MRKQILVIDDDEAVRKSFMLAFEDAGYAVDTAESGEKGTEKVQDNKVDLIFLDLKMPGLNGVETLRRLRELDKDVPIYIVTAFHKEFLDELGTAAEDGLSFEIISQPIGADKINLLARSVLEGPVEFQ